MLDTLCVLFSRCFLLFNLYHCLPSIKSDLFVICLISVNKTAICFNSSQLLNINHMCMVVVMAPGGLIPCVFFVGK